MPMSDLGSFKVLDVVATGTQFSDPINLADGDELVLTVSHPASTTSSYSIEIDNTPTGTLPVGAPVWAPYVVLNRADGVPLGTKAAAENFGIGCKPRSGRCRLKVVTASGTGNIVAWCHISRNKG